MPLSLKNRIVFILVCCFAVVCVLGAYANFFDNSFHFDDGHVIVDNLGIRNLANVPRFFTEKGWASSLPHNAAYRPIVTASLAFDYWWGGGLNFIPFHVTQFILLVLLGISLVLFYSAALKKRAGRHVAPYLALLAALFYCLHRANTETLNIISARSELLSAIGVMIAFLLYIYSPRARRWHLYLIPLLLGALAKITAVMFAPLFLLYLLMIQEGLSCGEILSLKKWKRIKTCLLMALPAFVLGLALFLFTEAMKPDVHLASLFNRWDYLRTQPFVWLRYFQLFVVPYGLSADTDWKIVFHWYDTRLFAGLSFIFLMTYAAFRLSRTYRGRPAAYGLLWFMIALLPASSIFSLSEVTNDHRAFFPYIGLGLSTVVLGHAAWRWLTERFVAKRRLISASFISIVLLVLAGHAWGTHQRNNVWHNHESLWFDVTIKSPTNGRGLMNYGITQMKRGRLKRAKFYFERAQQFTSDYSYLEINLGIVNEELGQSKTAEGHFKRALQLAPQQHSTHYYYGSWLLKHRRGPEALQHLQAAHSFSASDLTSKLQLMRVYAALGERDKLNALSQIVLALDPKNQFALSLATRHAQDMRNNKLGVAHYNTGVKFLDKKNYLAAAQSFQQALAYKKAVSTYNNLGWALEQLQFYERAHDFYEMGLALDPTNERSLNNLDNLKKKMGGTDD